MLRAKEFNSKQRQKITKLNQIMNCIQSGFACHGMPLFTIIHNVQSFISLAFYHFTHFTTTRAAPGKRWMNSFSFHFIHYIGCVYVLSVWNSNATHNNKIQLNGGETDSFNASWELRAESVRVYMVSYIHATNTFSFFIHCMFFSSSSSCIGSPPKIHIHRIRNMYMNTMYRDSQRYATDNGTLFLSSFMNKIDNKWR